MKRAHRGIVFLAVLLCAALIIPALASCDCRGDFRGSRMKNPTSYSLAATWLDGEDTHTLTLRAGDVLAVSFACSEGSMTMVITDPDGGEIYRGNGSVSDFRLNIERDGRYLVTVRGERATGSISISRVENK